MGSRWLYYGDESWDETFLRQEAVRQEAVDGSKNIMKIEVFKIHSGFVKEAYHVITNLRETDYQEVYTSSGKCPVRILKISWEISLAKWIIFTDSRPVAIFGVVDYGKDFGVPWMVATPELNLMKRYLIENSRKYICEMFEWGEFSCLVNYIDIRNKLSKKWLTWCGFTMGEIIPYGKFNKPFQKFYMIKNV